MSPRTDTCRNGHEREGNTYTSPRGKRACRECDRIATKRRRAGEGARYVAEHYADVFEDLAGGGDHDGAQFERDLRGDHDGPHSYWTPAYGTHETPTIAEVLSAWED